MSDAEAEAMFRQGPLGRHRRRAGVPAMRRLDAYECRRPNGAPASVARHAARISRITSGTLFASHKLPLRGYLAAIAIFCNEVKGKSMLAMSRDLGLSYKAAFVLCHKLREAMAEEMKGREIGGEGKDAEIDGGYFGGYVKPANLREHRKDRRFCEQPVRQAQGRRDRARARRQHVPAVFKTEGAGAALIRSRVADGTIVHADEAPHGTTCMPALK